MAAIAALSLLSVLSVYAHLLLVEHITCPEHGELIDRPADALQATAAERPRVPAHASFSAVDVADQHGHHHCEFVPKRREVFTSACSVSAFAAPPAITPIVSAPCDAPPLPAIAVLRLAPKQSPPA